MKTIDRLIAGLQILQKFDRSEIQAKHGTIYCVIYLDSETIAEMENLGWHYDYNSPRIYILVD